MNARNACRVVAAALLLVTFALGAAGAAGASGTPGESDAAAVTRRIQAADSSTTFAELTAVVRDAASCCARSSPLSLELTRWLRESHPIYSGRLPTDVDRFRGFLLASLGSFPASDELYAYVKAQLRFGSHAFDVATAAVAARGFASRADELLPLLERPLADTFMDASVDVTTPTLDYPLARPTTARREVLRTLAAFGARAARLAPTLDGIERCPNCGTYASDPALPVAAAEAARIIRADAAQTVGAGAERAAAESPTAIEAPPLRIIDARQRRSPVAKSLPLVDQEGRTLKFADLHDRPFALAFLYSRCANPEKCALTVRQLSVLASECAERGLASRVGIYGMTYDPQFDSPSILKRFGAMYGFKFDRNARLFTSTEAVSETLRDDLSLRVSYGAGSVNHHGVQLFVFDKKARIAAFQDNDAWSPADVREVLERLAAE
jgi:cytochrome oxidase Cu insertion factor (SCO1/SenC/PrrC family)